MAVELLAEETLSLADVHQIATRLGVARHAHVPAPSLPVQVSRKPVAAVKVPTGVAAAAAVPVGGGTWVRTSSVPRRPLALVRQHLPWRWRQDGRRVIAED